PGRRPRTPPPCRGPGGVAACQGTWPRPGFPKAMPALWQCSSHHLDFGLERAGSLDRLEYGDHVARADAEGIEPFDQLLQADARVDDREPVALFVVNGHLAARYRHGRAAIG